MSNGFCLAEEAEARSGFEIVLEDREWIVRGVDPTVARGMARSLAGVPGRAATRLHALAAPDMTEGWAGGDG